MMNQDNEPVEVTDENFGALLIQGVKEALAFERGEGPARVRVRHAVAPPLPPPPTYNAAQIRALRVRLGFNQRAFASALNVSDKTVKAWEQGINTPSGPSLRLLEIAERHPDALKALPAD